MIKHRSWWRPLGSTTSDMRQVSSRPDSIRSTGRTTCGQQACQELCVDSFAHHSGSRFVADERGLDDALAHFEFREDLLSDALTTADQTIGPHGRPMTVAERIDDMLARHGEDSPNARAHSKRGPYLVQAARRVARRLETAGVGRKAHRIF
jgi:hypothetical protein